MNICSCFPSSVQKDLFNQLFPQTDILAYRHNKVQETKNISENWITKQLCFEFICCLGAQLRAVHFFPYLAVNQSLVMQMVLTYSVLVLVLTSNKLKSILPLSGNWLSWLQMQWHVVCPQIIQFKISCNLSPS